MRRILLTIAVAAAFVYGGAVLYMMAQETRIVFQGGQPLASARPPAPFEQIELPRNDRSRQFAFALRVADGADAAPWLLYLHGNRATVASRTNLLRYEGFRALGLNVLAPEYRGFGGLDGEPSEASVTADARAGYEYLREVLDVPAERIVVFGWSLGSAVAVNLASTEDEAAVILEGAPASLVAIGERDYPWLPVRLVMRNPFESILKAPRISSPVLLLHSPDDGIIPIEESRRLFDALRGPKQFVEVRGGHIRPAEDDGERYFSAVGEFLRAHGILR